MEPVNPTPLEYDLSRQDTQSPSNRSDERRTILDWPVGFYGGLCKGLLGVPLTRKEPSLDEVFRLLETKFSFLRI